MKRQIFQIISNIFHPLLSMVLATVMLVTVTPLVVWPSVFKWFIVGEVAFYSMLLPSLIIVLLSKFGIIKNGVALRDRKDRIIPLGIQVVAYYFQAYTLSFQGIPSWALQYYYGAFLLASVCFVISIWWKISAHAAANASMATAALLLYYQFPNILPLILPLFFIVMTGFISSIRLYLGRHTLAQVACGALAGTVCMILGGLFV